MKIIPDLDTVKTTGNVPVIAPLAHHLSEPTVRTLGFATFWECSWPKSKWLFQSSLHPGRHSGGDPLYEDCRYPD